MTAPSLYFSDNLEQAFQEYASMSVQEAAEAECPIMFISFPSAKDPEWEEKYPGEYDILLLQVSGYILQQMRGGGMLVFCFYIVIHFALTHLCCLSSLVLHIALVSYTSLSLGDDSKSPTVVVSLNKNNFS